MNNSTTASRFSMPETPAARRVWLLALVLVAGFCSFMACLTPFSALAVALAATTRLRHAGTAMFGMWVINQAVGYGFLDFPQRWDSYAWGVVTLLAALAAIAVADLVMRRLPLASKLARVGVAYLAAHALYELVLFAAVPALGGGAAFAADIMWRIFLGNALWLACLVVFNELLALAMRPWLGNTPHIVRAS